MDDFSRDIIAISSFIFFLKRNYNLDFNDYIELNRNYKNFDKNLWKYSVNYLSEFDKIVSIDLAINRKDTILIYYKSKKKYEILEIDLGRETKILNNALILIDSPTNNINNNIPFRFSEYIIKKLGFKILPINFKSMIRLREKATKIIKGKEYLEIYPNIYYKILNIKMKKSDKLDAVLGFKFYLDLINYKATFIYGEIAFPLREISIKNIEKYREEIDKGINIIKRWYEEYSKKYLT